VSIALWLKVETLEKLTGEQQRRIEALYAEVRSIFEQHQGPKRLTAKRVIAKLVRNPKPSVRHVQVLLQRAREELKFPPW
jgi:hypothetical protein